jgi:hypothetical protein
MTQRFGAILTGRLDNLTATTDPTTGDDSADGYAAGSLWLNTTSGHAWLCFDASVGAAVWGDVTVISTAGGEGIVSLGSVATCLPEGFTPLRGAGSGGYSKTTAEITAVEILESISVARITVGVNAAIASSSARIAYYSSDGQTKLIDVTITTTSTGQASATLSPVILLPGVYLVLACQATGGAGLRLDQWQSSDQLKAGITSSLLDTMGTIAISGGAAPSNFDPTSLTTGLQNTIAAHRLDNA